MNTMDQLVNAQMDIQDITDDVVAKQQEVNINMRKIYQDKGVYGADKFHRYEFDLPNIQDLNYEREHGGKSKLHVENCNCLECKPENYKKQMVKSKSTAVI